MGNEGYIAGVVVLCTVAAATTVGRFKVRNISIKQFTPSEYVIVTSLALFVALNCLNISILRETNPVKITQLVFAGTLTHFSVIWSIKISVNLLYIRLTANLESLHKIYIASLVFICATGMATLLVEIFSCWPIERRFTHDPTITCDTTSSDRIFWTVYTFNISTDLLLFVLPFPLVRNISHRTLQLALGITFGFAFLVPMMATVSAVLINTNGFGNLPIIILSSSCECCVGMIIGALPGLSNPWMQKIQQTGDPGRLISFFRKLKKDESSPEMSGDRILQSIPEHSPSLSNSLA